MTHQNTPLVLIDREKETNDTESFYFQSKEQPLFSFKPGQFVLLDVNINGNTQTRAYSISSQPNSDTLKLTIKRVENGLVSNWLIDNLQPNNEVIMRDIAGEFNIIDRPYHKKILFVSAGCGITPVMSMAQYLLAQDTTVNIDFLHCAKDVSNVIYSDQLSQMASEYSQFNYHLRLKNTISERTLPNSSIGRITAQFLLENYPDINQYSVFLCGSHKFMTNIADVLEELKFDMNQFYHENFTPDCSSETTAVTTNLAVKVAVPAFGFEQTVAVGDNLLAILESGQLPIIGACRSGVCGSCKCKVDHGEVESSSYSTLTQEEIEQGYHLACSTVIKGDIKVSLN